MADLLKIKQVDGLGTSLDSLELTTSVDSKDTSILALATAADTAQSVDSKDTSILALATAADTAQSVDSKDASVVVVANGYTDAQITAESIDSKDTSILALATAADTAQSVDSKDTSILALATAADTAQSVDSKDTSILALATAADTAQSVDSKDASVVVYVDGEVSSIEDAFLREEALVTESWAGNNADIVNTSGTTYTIALANNLESQDDDYVLGIWINGLFTKYSVTGAAQLTISTIGYSLDANDTVVAKYIKAHD